MMDKLQWQELMVQNANKSMYELHKRANSSNLVRNIQDREDQQLVWVNGDDDDQKYQDKSSLALTIIRSSYVHVPGEFVADLNDWLGSHGIESKLNGYVHLNPGTNRALNIVIGRTHWAKTSNELQDLQDSLLQEQLKMEAILKSKTDENGESLLANESFINVVQFDGAKIFEKPNVFSDVLTAMSVNDNGNEELSAAKQSQFNLLKEYGMSFMCKRTSSANWRIGFSQVAYVATNSSIEDEAEQCSMKVKANTLLSIPTYNVQPDSNSKNIRTELPPMHEESIKVREDFLKGLFEHWLMMKNISSGQADEELERSNGFIAKRATKEERIEFREKGMRTLKSKVFGQAKQLSYNVFRTSVFNGQSKSGVRYNVFVSPDMSIADGQHSARDLGLIIWALEHRSTPIYSETIVSDLLFSEMEKKFKKFIEEEVEKKSFGHSDGTGVKIVDELNSKNNTNYENVDDIADFEFTEDEAASESLSFENASGGLDKSDKEVLSVKKERQSRKIKIDKECSDFAKKLGFSGTWEQQCKQMFADAADLLPKVVCAQVNANPNTLERQASATTAQLNTQRTVNKESLIQKKYEKAISIFCTKFNDISQKRGAPNRLYWAKHIGANSAVCTNKDANVMFEDLVPYIEVIQKSKNAKKAWIDGASDAVDKLKRAGALKIDSQTSSYLKSALAGLAEVLTNFKGSGRIGLSELKLSTLFKTHLDEGLSLPNDVLQLLKVNQVSTEKKGRSFFDKLVYELAKKIEIENKGEDLYERKLFVIVNKAMQLREVVERYKDSFCIGAGNVFNNATGYYNHVFGLLYGMQAASSGANKLLESSFIEILDKTLERWTKVGKNFNDAEQSKNVIIQKVTADYLTIKQSMRTENDTFGRSGDIERTAYEKAIIMAAEQMPDALMYMVHHYPMAELSNEVVNSKQVNCVELNGSIEGKINFKLKEPVYLTKKNNY